MKTLIFKIVIVLYLLVLSISCSDNPKLMPVEEDKLPAITQTGENTFGCLINGNVFVPKDKTGYTPPGDGRPRGISIFSGEFSNTADYFSITARNYIYM